MQKTREFLDKIIYNLDELVTPSFLANKIEIEGKEWLNNNYIKIDVESGELELTNREIIDKVNFFLPYLGKYGNNLPNNLENFLMNRKNKYGSLFLDTNSNFYMEGGILFELSSNINTPIEILEELKDHHYEDISIRASIILDEINNY